MAVSFGSSVEVGKSDSVEFAGNRRLQVPTTPRTSPLNAAVTQHQKLPILHFSMHGDTEGLQLTNGDLLSWADLRKTLDPITNAMNGGLLVCLSSCQGAAGCRMAMHHDSDKPFWQLVGNVQEVVWADAAVAYITFYHSFFKGVPFEECVARMRTASGDPNFISFAGSQVKADWAAYSEKSRQSALVQALRDYSAQRPPIVAGLLGGAP
jgi:hypothetical protein